MVAKTRQWVIDTSVYTHLCRAGHSEIIERLAPGGFVLVPDDVNAEIERGRDKYDGIPSVASVPWAKTAVLTEEEIFTQTQVKSEMGGSAAEHLGECAVVACAHHREMAALLDERAAIAQATRFGVVTYDTLWLVVEAYKSLYGRDRGRTAKMVDDLLHTGMYLPIDSGTSLISWSYEEGLLP
jgi:predicted nucleic acid-binding protein